MTLSGHAAATILTLHYTHDPVILILMNIILHILLDAIPHAEWSTFQGSKLKMATYTLIDGVIGLWLIALAFSRVNISPWLISFAFIAGLWLDILDALTSKWLKKLRFYHQYLHTWPLPPINPVNWDKTVTGKVPTWAKIAFQLLLIALAVFALPR